MRDDCIAKIWGDRSYRFAPHLQTSPGRINLAHLRVTAFPQGRRTCRGDVWRLRICPDVIEYLPDISTVRDQGDDAHLPTTDRDSSGNCSEMRAMNSTHRPWAGERLGDAGSGSGVGVTGLPDPAGGHAPRPVLLDSACAAAKGAGALWGLGHGRHRCPQR